MHSIIFIAIYYYIILMIFTIAVIILLQCASCLFIYLVKSSVGKHVLMVRGLVARSQAQTSHQQHTLTSLEEEEVMSQHSLSD